MDNSRAMLGRVKQTERRQDGRVNVGLLLLIVAAIVAVGIYLTSSKRTPTASAQHSSSGALSVAPATLITNLATIDLSKGTPTAEQVAAWKQTLKSLTSQGTAAVPAIRDFLAHNQDIYFDGPGAAELFGVPSLRLALVQALAEIGGPDAVATAQKTCAATADPAELATLAKFLEKAEPGKHRDEFLKAAKETLAIAASGNWDGRDVAPLFEILQTFGSTNEISEVERYANTWFDYAAITLVRWPDSAGIPTLIRLARNENGAITLGRDIYQRMLTEAAVHHPAAVDELMAQVRDNKIDVAAWPGLGQALAGFTLHLGKAYVNPPSPLTLRPDTRVLHVSFGNQNYLEAAPADMPQKEVGDRIRLVDRLLENTTNPAATDAFEAARIALSARLPKAK